VIVHLVDGTYELFRSFFSPAAAFDRSAPEELRAVRGVVGSMLGMLEGGATHLGVATDHVIESFRNGLWPGYKTGEGVDPLLLAQFQPLEEALSALGVVVWPMVEFEADDALAAAAAMAAADARVDQVVICTPDKDLAQCVRQRRRLPRFAGLGRGVGDGGPRSLSAPRAHSEAGHGVGGVRAWSAAPGHDAHGATRARAALPRAGHVAWGCSHRRRRGRAAVEGTARRLRDLVRATRYAGASGARLEAGSNARRRDALSEWRHTPKDVYSTRQTSTP